MIYNSFAISYALESTTTPKTYGAYVDISSKLTSCDLIKGEINCRPLKNATGFFTDMTMYRIDLQLVKGQETALDNIVAGTFIKIKTDDNVTVTEQEFLVSAKVWGETAAGAKLVSISLTPAHIGLNGSEAKVSLSLHA